VLAVGVAGIVSTLLAVFARYLIGTIESAQLTPLIAVLVFIALGVYFVLEPFRLHFIRLLTVKAGPPGVFLVALDAFIFLRVTLQATLERSL